MKNTDIVCLSIWFVLTGKGGTKGGESKKTLKKSSVAKPNTIKSLFMNSNVKRPAEVGIYENL